MKIYETSENMIIKTKAIVPTYFKEFKCTGSECRYTCCQEWKISIDKKTYTSYKNLKTDNKEMKENISKYIKRDRKSMTDEGYGIIHLCPQTRKCAFLKDGLCSIQVQEGYKQLCYTCKIYPRLHVKINQELFLGCLTLSCEAANNLILQNPSYMEFEVINLEVSEYQYQSVTVADANQVLADNFLEIQMVSISILQNRVYTIEKRLLILGMFFEQLQKMSDEKTNSATIGQYVKEFEQLMFTDAMKEQMQAINFNGDTSSIVRTLLFLLLQTNNGLSSNQKIMDRLLDVIDQDIEQGVNNVDVLKLMEKYKLGKEKSSIYFKDKEYIFEHFLVNSLFEKRVPFVHELSVWDSYCFLVSLYCIWKSVVMIDIASSESYNDEKFSDMTALICRNLFHGSFMKDNVLKYITNEKLNDFESMQKMINN